jgi:hypothetical protein
MPAMTDSLRDEGGRCVASEDAPRNAVMRDEAPGYSRAAIRPTSANTALRVDGSVV